MKYSFINSTRHSGYSNNTNSNNTTYTIEMKMTESTKCLMAIAISALIAGDTAKFEKYYQIVAERDCINILGEYNIDNGEEQV